MDKLLGMNARNLSYLIPYNRKRAIAIADSKLETKKVLERNEIPVPHFLGVIQNVGEVLDFDWLALPERFAVKPNSGYGGEGIVVLNKKIQTEDGETRWMSSAGEEWTVKALQAHTLNILDGSYSLSNSPDVAFFEEKILNATEFRELSPKGIPDIRVIVFNGIPVMAMLRVPTELSKGRANLMKGAIGIGVDLSSGITTSAVVKKPRRKIIDEHPDTGVDLQNVQIPFWNDILNIAIRCQEVTGLGYIGVDVAIDKYRGPVVLEINARPGLEIQVANLASLEDRLRRVKGLKVASIAKGIALAKELFGGEIERKVEETIGKKILGAMESIKIRDNKKNLVQVLAKIDTGKNISLIDTALAEKLEIPIRTRSFSENSSKRKVVEVVMYVHGERIETLLAVEDFVNTKHKVVLARRDLRNFLVDPSKK
jgi:alpha-L-glutamate ligase-like protein